MAVLNEYESSTLSRSSGRIPTPNQHPSGSYHQPNLVAATATTTTTTTATPYHSKSKSEDSYSSSCNGGNQWPRENGPTTTPTSLPSMDSKILKKYEFLGINPPISTMSRTSDTSTSLSSKVDAMSLSYHESVHGQDDRNDVTTPHLMSTSLINFDSGHSSVSTHLENSNFSSNDYAKSKSQSFSKIHNLEEGRKTDTCNQNDGIEKLNGLVSELNKIVKSGFGGSSGAGDRREKSELVKSPSKFILPLEEAPNRNGSRQESKFILPLEEINIVLRRQQFGMKKGELKNLQSEQSRLLEAINNVKTKLLDIQQQKDEIIREVS